VNDASGVEVVDKEGMAKRSEKKGSVDIKGSCLGESLSSPTYKGMRQDNDVLDCHRSRGLSLSGTKILCWRSRGEVPVPALAETTLPSPQMTEFME